MRMKVIGFALSGVLLALACRRCAAADENTPDRTSRAASLSSVGAQHRGLPAGVARA
jgi:hypothetical protein